MRAWEMARQVTEHELKRNRNAHVRKTFEARAAERLAELKMPSLVIIGEKDSAVT